MNAQGMPASWQHYQVGISHLRRSDAVETLRVHHATLSTQYKQRDRERWQRFLQMMAN